jgi:hypothetical protein
LLGLSYEIPLDLVLIKALDVLVRLTPDYFPLKFSLRNSSTVDPVKGLSWLVAFACSHTAVSN